jgi:tripartite-type tricarboxylate transporter receptor subunit TctC
VLADVMGGQIALTMDNIPPYLPQVRAGKIRALAVSPAKRTPAAPDIPTVAEAGVPGYDSGAWFGLLAPAGTPKPIVDKLTAETQRILKLPDVHERISSLGAEIVGSSSAEFGALIKSEIAKWAKVIKEAHVELQ